MTDGRETYQIKVKGVLDEKWSDWFNGLTIETEGSVTTLTGAVDQSGLHGILIRIGDLT